MQKFYVPFLLPRINSAMTLAAMICQRFRNGVGGRTQGPKTRRSEHTCVCVQFAFALYNPCFREDGPRKRVRLRALAIHSKWPPFKERIAKLSLRFRGFFLGARACIPQSERAQRSKKQIAAKNITKKHSSDQSRIVFFNLGLVFSIEIGLFNRDYFFQSRVLAEAVSMPRNIVI